MTKDECTLTKGCVLAPSLTGRHMSIMSPCCHQRLDAPWFMTWTLNSCAINWHRKWWTHTHTCLRVDWND